MICSLLLVYFQQAIIVLFFSYSIIICLSFASRLFLYWVTSFWNWFRFQSPLLTQCLICSWNLVSFSRRFASFRSWVHLRFCMICEIPFILDFQIYSRNSPLSLQCYEISKHISLTQHPNSVNQSLKLYSTFPLYFTISSFQFVRNHLIRSCIYFLSYCFRTPFFFIFISPLALRQISLRQFSSMEIVSLFRVI